MLHGSQGCTAFGKVFLVRRFRAPTCGVCAMQAERCSEETLPLRHLAPSPKVITAPR